MSKDDFKKELYRASLTYLKTLCVDIPDRSVGSEGNRIAARFFEKEISSHGWETEMPEFDAVDWIDGGASLKIGEVHFEVFVSPYSLGCLAEAELVQASNLAELERLDPAGKIVLLHGDVAREPLMPKNFVFYNPEEHQKIIALLENGRPLAIICATGRNAALAGGVYPFPLIEDGDFDIPSVYMTEEEGLRLLPFAGEKAALKSVSRRVPGKACNVIARKGNRDAERIVITAHIDAKKGTPGAVDNATGVVVLLLVSRLLKEYAGSPLIEIVAFNGEDYYAVSGQMNYISANRQHFDTILYNINIDGAGYREGPTAFSFYGLPDGMRKAAEKVIKQYPGLAEGPPWPQGDHSIFIQYGRPAVAVTSAWFSENTEAQEITHTPKDNLEIVEAGKLVEIAEAISELAFPCFKISTI